MQNLKEWLNTKTCEYKQATCMFGHSEWIEIPEGAEIAIQFKNDPDEHGIIFYKNGGESCMGKNDNNWKHDSEWTMDQLLDENYHEGVIDLSHDILWQRATHPEELPFIDDEPRGLNDQYAEIEQVRQAIKVKSGSDSDHALDAMSFGIIGARAAQASGGVDATLAERQSTYGNFEDVAFVTENIMAVLSEVRPDGLKDLPNAHRMALYMIASKMARIVNGDFNHLDSWHDIGGYSKLIEKLIKGE